MTPKGKIYHAHAHGDLQKTRPLFAFVPDSLIKGDGALDKAQYVTKRWATINAGANIDAVGSHVFPDLKRPATETESKDFLAALARLIHKSIGAPTPIRKPGRGGFEMQ